MAQEVERLGADRSVAILCRHNFEFRVRVDAMRDYIDQMDLTPDVRAVVLVSLMEAADRVDSTTAIVVKTKTT